MPRIRPESPFIPRARPEPPADLVPPEAADEWRAIVARLPAEWFTEETFGILRELCAHLAYAKQIRAGIEEIKAACVAEGKSWALDPAWSAKLSARWADHKAQTQSIATLATKLRLTNQSRYQPDKAEDERAKVAAAAGRKPWESWGNDGDEARPYV